MAFLTKEPLKTKTKTLVFILIHHMQIATHNSFAALSFSQLNRDTLSFQPLIGMNLMIF